MKVIHCAICNKKEKTKLLYKESSHINQIDEKIFSARCLPDKIHYRLLKCLRCGLIFSNPIFDSRKINNLYKKSDFTYQAEAEFLKKTYGFYLKDVLAKLKKRNVDLWRPNT